MSTNAETPLVLGFMSYKKNHFFLGGVVFLPVVVLKKMGVELLVVKEMKANGFD